jgi:hypothetical protein
MDGGTFSSDIDGGGLTGFAPIDIYDGITVSLDSAYLYSSGNSILRLATGIGYSFVIETGLYSHFFRITPTVSNNTYNLGLTGEVIKLVPNNTYKLYNSAENIIYSTAPLQNLTITGSGINNTTSTTDTPPTVNQEGDFDSQYNYYNFQPMDSYEIIPSQHLLYVYNLNSQESIDIKNYYFQMRTGITGANILGISCNIGYSGETTDTGNYINNIRTPIHRFIMTGNKPIKYGCLFHGIPTKITGTSITNCISATVNYDLSNSLNQISGYSRPSQFTYPKAFYQRSRYNYRNSPSIERPFLFEEFTGTSALFTHLCSLQTRTADVSGYIRKICQDGKVSGVYLMGSGQNNLFVCYSNNGYGFYTDRAIIDTFEVDRELSFYSDLGVNISFSKSRTEVPYMTGYNICGFTSDGYHMFLYTGGTGVNPVDGPGGGWESSPTACQFSGYNWYLSSHYESFAGNMLTFEFLTNGQEMTPHSPVSKQIRPTAMGGSNYSNIPIGFVGASVEPSTQGIEKIIMYDAWFKGLPFIEAAYIGLYDENYFVWGDPLTKWR